MQKPPEVVQPFIPFDFSRLKVFHPALIYTFKPEDTLRTFPDDLHYLFYNFRYACGQMRDLLEAYVYAETVILTEIRQIGITNITPEQLLHWLDQIHLRIANSMAKDAQAAGHTNVKAGEYSKSQVVRWKSDARAYNIYRDFLLDISSEEETLKLTTEIGIAIEDSRQYMRVLTRLRNDSTIPIPQQNAEGSSPDSNRDYTCAKLSYCYHRGGLTAEEKAAVDRIVKHCIPPEQYPQARQEFAEKIIQQLRRLNPNNIDEVVDLIFNLFYSATDIHCYFNGNGRDITCFDNVMLVALGYPYILMRTMNDCRNPESLYAKGILHIDSKPEILKEHLKKRILDAKQNGTYHHEKMQRATELQVKMDEIITQIIKQFTDYNIIAAFNDYYIIPNEQLSKNYPKKLEEQLVVEAAFIEKCYETFKDLYKKLLQQKLAPAIVSPAVQAKPASKERALVINQIERITGITGALYSTQNDNYVIVLPNGKQDSKLAKKIVRHFHTTNTAKAEWEYNTQTKKYVVKLRSINITQLQAISPCTIAQANNTGVQKRTP